MRLTEWSATLDFDPDKPLAGAVTVTLKAASVDTRTPRRDDDIRANYFVVDSFHDVKFTSTRVEMTRENVFKLAGNLTIKGVTRPVVLDVEMGGRADHASRAAYVIQCHHDHSPPGVRHHAQHDGRRRAGRGRRDSDSHRPGGGEAGALTTS
ncbi:MAG: YceI family protein [Gemmatimonas sp.]